MSSSGESVSGVLRRIVAWSERHPALIIGTWVAALGAALMLRALGRPLWHDEIWTLLVARLSLADMARAYVSGYDFAPPLYALCVHGLMTFAPGTAVVARLPAAAAFAVASTMIFVIVRRRSTTLGGVAGAATLMLTGAWRYAVEARGYGLTVALFAIALYAWAELSGVHRRRHAVMLAAALGAGLWSHYYFALAFVPIAAGELVRQRSQRRFDLVPWLSIMAGAAALVPLLPAIAAAAEHRASFWTRDRLPDVWATYRFVLGSWMSVPGRIALGTVLALVVASGVRRMSVTRSEPEASSRPGPLHAHIVTLVLCLLIPALGALLGRQSGVFTERYVIFAAVGFAIVAPITVWSVRFVRSRADLLFAATAISAAAFAAWSTWYDISQWRPLDDHPVLVSRLQQSQEPVVVTGGTAYLQLWFYTPADWKPRVIYLADPVAEEQATGGRTVDLNYLSLRMLTSVPVVDANTFLAGRHRFLLYTFGDSWIEIRLHALGATLTELGSDTGRLYEVRLPGH